MLKYKLEQELTLNQDVELHTEAYSINAKMGSEVIIMGIDKKDDVYPYYVFFCDADEYMHLQEDLLFEITEQFI